MNERMNTDRTRNSNLQGDAAFWWNLKRSGDGDVSTRHAGCPVLVGSKWGEWKRIFSCTWLRPHVVANLVFCRPPRYFVTRLWLPAAMSSEKDFPCLVLVSPNIAPNSLLDREPHSSKKDLRSPFVWNHDRPRQSCGTESCWTLLLPYTTA